MQRKTPMLPKEDEKARQVIPAAVGAVLIVALLVFVTNLLSRPAPMRVDRAGEVTSAPLFYATSVSVPTVAELPTVEQPTIEQVAEPAAPPPSFNAAAPAVVEEQQPVYVEQAAPVVEVEQAPVAAPAPPPAVVEDAPLKIREEDSCNAEHGRCTPPCTAEHGRCEPGKP